MRRWYVLGGKCEAIFFPRADREEVKKKRALEQLIGKEDGRTVWLLWAGSEESGENGLRSRGGS